MADDEIAWYTGLLGWVWVFKALSSPFLEIASSKRYLLLFFQFAGSISLGLVALVLPLPDYFRGTKALLVVVSFCSATHDTTADGLDIARLSEK